MAAVYVSPSHFNNQQCSQSTMSLLGATATTVIIAVTITTANADISGFKFACFNRIAPLTIGYL